MTLIFDKEKIGIYEFRWLTNFLNSFSKPHFILLYEIYINKLACFYQVITLLSITVYGSCLCEIDK